MYEELLRTLRSCPDAEYGCSNCKYQNSLGCREKLMSDASNAIDELSAYVRQIEELRKEGWYLQKTKMMTYGQATMTKPLPVPPKEET